MEAQRAYSDFSCLSSLIACPQIYLQQLRRYPEHMETLFAKFTDASAVQYLAALVSIVWLVGMTGVRGRDSQMIRMRRLVLPVSLGLLVSAVAYGLYG